MPQLIAGDDINHVAAAPYDFRTEPLGGTVQILALVAEIDSHPAPAGLMVPFVKMSHRIKYHTTLGTIITNNAQDGEINE